MRINQHKAFNSLACFHFRSPLYGCSCSGSGEPRAHSHPGRCHRPHGVREWGVYKQALRTGLLTYRACHFATFPARLSNPSTNHKKIWRTKKGKDQNREPTQSCLPEAVANGQHSQTPKHGSPAVSAAALGQKPPTSGLSFLICKMEMITEPMPQCMRGKA